MSDESKQLSKARQALVDRVLSRLDEGALPWDNGMQGISELPRNAITGKPYRGMNVLNLMLTFKQDPRWLTFNQAKDNGYTVKKGAKGVPIELYKTIDKRTGKEADIDAIREEVKDMTFDERQRFKKENLQSFARSYYVFNASDIHGIEPYKAPELTAADISARNERIENVIAGSQAPIFYDGNGRNYYRPSSDEIHLTDRVAFKSDEFFYNTALHEMAHSTGHSSRLNRTSGTFGSKAYAREELVAETASVLIAAELGLNNSDRVIENSAEYVRGWATLIRDNPQTLIDAAFDASKATDFVCGMERQQERPQEKTQKESLLSRTSQPYDRYSALQDKYSDAVVVMRVGDFYEIMGEKARAAADELNLTLTSRSVGLPERVPMCGFPYHVMEQYTEKLLEKHSVVIAENEGDEKYILSHAEAQKTPLEARTQKESLQSNVRDWYTHAYPTDYLGNELSAAATFGTVRDGLKSGQGIYEIIGVEDSLVRERVFGKLAKILDVPYKAVYDKWLESTESAENRRERQRQAAMQDFPKDFADEALLDAAEDFARHTPSYGATEQPKAPHDLKTKLDNIPEAMKALPNWVAFRTEQTDGKVKKILLSPNKGASSVEYLKWAKSDDPTTWATFDKAVAFAKKYKLDGLAFAMSGSGMTCIDLDHHLDEHGKPSELAQKFIGAAQGTYIEKSVSGRGLHIFYAGNRPSDRQNRNIELDLETYDSARFMSMTGDLYGNAPKEVKPPSAELDNLLKSNLVKLQQYSAPSAPLGMADNELIDRIRSSKVGREFDELISGQILTYKANGDPDHSTSDFKLCNMLAFFSGGDAQQVERVFRSSGLYRPQKGDAYVRRTVEKACTTLSKHYEPKSFGNSNKSRGNPRGNGGRGSSGR